MSAVVELWIPARLRETAVAWEGEPARAWLGRLPGIVRDLVVAWDLGVGTPLEPGGHISWVAPATRRSDGAQLVLKVQLPHPESAPEATALEAWGGAGAVRLHRHDPGRAALLLERCVPGSALADLDDGAAAFDAGLAVAAQLHVDPPGDVPALIEVATGWAEVVERRGRPQGLADDVWRIALDTMRGEVEAGRSVLLHGDLNPTNVLAAGRGWLAIDPKPLAGDPAYDSARLLLQLAHDGPDPVAVVGRRVHTAASALGVSPDAVARWCLAEAVQMASFSRAVGAVEASEAQVEWTTWVLPHLG